MQEFIKTIGDAELVKYHETGNELIVSVWFGGTTVNDFSVYDGTYYAFNCWSVSDEQGYPLDAEEMEVRMQRHMDENGWEFEL